MEELCPATELLLLVNPGDTVEFETEGPGYRRPGLALAAHQWAMVAVPRAAALIALLILGRISYSA